MCKCIGMCECICVRCGKIKYPPSFVCCENLMTAIGSAIAVDSEKDY